MSTDPRGELIRGARPNVGDLQRKRNKKSDIPTPNTSEKDNVLARLTDRKSK